MDQAQIDKLKEELIADEGFRQFPYKDTTGHLTIGVGRNLSEVGISKVEAYALLSNDINSAWNDLIKALPWIINLDTARQRIIVNLCFNLGIAGLTKFKNMLNNCRLGKFNEAADDMLDSLAARQAPNRYTRLATKMRSGDG